MKWWVLRVLIDEWYVGTASWCARLCRKPAETQAMAIADTARGLEREE